MKNINGLEATHTVVSIGLLSRIAADERCIILCRRCREISVFVVRGDLPPEQPCAKWRVYNSDIHWKEEEGSYTWFLLFPLVLNTRRWVRGSSAGIPLGYMAPPCIEEIRSREL